MINLTANTTNTFVITVTENVTISNPYYLFQFEYDMTNEVDTFLSTNVSTATTRYDMFNLTVTGSTAEPLSGQTNWSPYKGNYGKYTVYQVSGETLEVSAATATLEVGKFKINGGHQITGYTADNNVNEYVYPNN